MGKVEDLIRNYEEFARLPWDERIAGAERVWFVIHDPADERRVRRRLGEFANATARAGHLWKPVDLTDAFAEWMAEHDYRDMYFEEPEQIEPSLADFAQRVADRVADALASATPDTVVAVTGAAACFGFTRISELIDEVADDIQGRLLVFFPGSHEGNVFRLLDARDGWNYRAVPITA